MKMKSKISQEDRFHILLMGAVDDELSAEEKAEFEKLLSSNEEYRKEFEQYKKLKEVTLQMRLPEPPMELWDSYWLNVYNRIERGISWLLITIGAVILLTFGSFKLVENVIASKELEWIAKAGILFVLGGLSVLVVSVVREKWFTRKKDPYREVMR